MNTESTPPAKPTTLLPDPQIMIMLIDDQAMVGEAVRRKLADQPDMDLHYCSDPLACIEQVGQIKPTVILLDLVMPQIDGLEVLRLLRDNPQTMNIPVVMLSTADDAEIKSRAFAAGANDYLVKLPDKIELIARIRYHSKSYLNLLQRDEAHRALRKSQQQLLDSNTALSAINQAFLQAKEEAERANKSKSEFLSRMSHELRTPLNAILGFGQLLEMDSLSPSQQESVGQILKGGRHLLDLINEILDIARIEAGRLSLSLEPVSVGETAREVLQLVEPLANQAKIQLQDDISEVCEKFILCDRQRLKQVLLNLLANAVKYNRPGGKVRVFCEERKQQMIGESISGRSTPGMSTPEKSSTFLRIFVEDNGFGIASADIPRLFAPFERFQTMEGTIEGTGLGLALSKRLIEVMDGAIGVESTLGEGSVFWIELPVTEEPVEQHKRNKSVQLIAPLTTPATSKKILYIEDNLSNLTLVEHILDTHPGVELMSAMQGSLGFELACEHHPDLILLDLHLPDMPGHEVLQRLQAEPRTRSIPVVVISANAIAGQVERTKTAGAAAYLSKPIDVEHFLRVLKENLDKN